MYSGVWHVMRLRPRHHQIVLYNPGKTPKPLLTNDLRVFMSQKCSTSFTIQLNMQLHLQ